VDVDIDVDLLETLLFQQGIREINEKKYEGSKKIFENVLVLNEKNNLAWYNLACSLSLLGEKEKAIRAIEKSVEFGFEDFAHMMNDEDLKGISNEDGFRVLLQDFLARLDQNNNIKNGNIVDKKEVGFNQIINGLLGRNEKEEREREAERERLEKEQKDLFDQGKRKKGAGAGERNGEIGN